MYKLIIKISILDMALASVDIQFSLYRDSTTKPPEGVEIQNIPLRTMFFTSFTTENISDKKSFLFKNL